MGLIERTKGGFLGEVELAHPTRANEHAIAGRHSRRSPRRRVAGRSRVMRFKLSFGNLSTGRERRIRMGEAGDVLATETAHEQNYNHQTRRL